GEPVASQGKSWNVVRTPAGHQAEREADAGQRGQGDLAAELQSVAGELLLQALRRGRSGRGERYSRVDAPTWRVSPFGGFLPLLHHRSLIRNRSDYNFEKRFSAA